MNPSSDVVSSVAECIVMAKDWNEFVYDAQTGRCQRAPDVRETIEWPSMEVTRCKAVLRT
jgi:hypothetical protein